MTGFSPAEMIGDNVAIVIPILVVLLGLIVLYYVLIIRAILQMLGRRAPSVLITFSFIALVPFPLALILGISILIIWHYHKIDYQKG